MLKRTTALGVSRLVGASWVRRPGRTFCPQLVPPSSHLASWHLFIKTAAGKIRYCKRLLSHPGQERACTRIIGCLLGTMPKMAQYTGKWLLLSPYWSHPRPHKMGKRDEQSNQSFAQFTVGLVGFWMKSIQLAFERCIIMLLPLLSSLGLGQSGICWGKPRAAQY